MLKKFVQRFIDVFTPNKDVSKRDVRIAAGVLGLLILLTWQFSTMKFLPKPLETIHALIRLWTEENLAGHMWVSFKLNLHALAITTVISLGLSYLSVVPAVRPLVGVIGTMRFFSLNGYIFFLMQAIGGGYGLKLWLLVISMGVYFVTHMSHEIASIPQTEYDHARTLGMSEWEVILEVVVIGKLDKAIECMGQNAAMGWAVITIAEGLSRSEGGIGALFLNEDKHFNIDAVAAIYLFQFLVSLVQDKFIRVFLKNKICPYIKLMMERR
ncbi:MAG: nitrate ABC transporter permease [bacterium]|nr:nitrate ABC transporter permease [bacterium]